MKKKIYLIIFICFSFILQVNKVSAEYENQNFGNSENIVLAFNLNDLNNEAKISIITSVGKEAELTIERESNINDFYMTSQVLENKTYTITYKSINEKISYKIDVINKNIISAHTGSYSVYGYFIKSSNLRRISTKHATYEFECSILLNNWSSSLESKIIGDKLQVRFVK